MRTHRLWRVRYDDGSVSKSQAIFPSLSMRYQIETARADENWNRITEWEAWSGNINNKQSEVDDV